MRNLTKLVLLVLIVMFIACEQPPFIQGQEPPHVAKEMVAEEQREIQEVKELFQTGGKILKELFQLEPDIDITMICGEEISESQAKELAQIVADFQTAVTQERGPIVWMDVNGEVVKGSSHFWGAGPGFDAILLEHWNKYQSVLLPTQLETILEKSHWLPHLTTTRMVASRKFSTEMGITPEQKKELIDRSQKLHQEIESTIAELEKKLDLHRQKIDQLCKGVLTETQYEKLDERYDIKSFLKDRNAFMLNLDTDFHSQHSDKNP